MGDKDQGASIEIDSVSLGGGDGHRDLADHLAGDLRSFSKGQPTRVMGPAVEKKEAVDGNVKKADEGGVEETVQASSLPPEELQNQAFMTAGALLPPWPPMSLLEIYRMSNSLRSNIDAYKTNIDGFGYSLEPIIDLDSDEARNMAAEELRREIEEGRKEEDREGELPDFEDDDWQTVVDERIARLKKEAAEEKIRLRNFWDYAALDMSLIQLRKRTRQDIELIGYGGWEVLKNRKGEVAKFVHVPAQTLRLMPADKEPLKIEVQERVGPFKMEPVDIYYRFRRFVHYQTSSGMQSGPGSGKTVYFKEWGDPRTVSQDTGRYFADVAALKMEEGEEAKVARELLYFDLHNPDSPYGEPRWLGGLLSVLGSRESEEVNYLYFRNKSIPPMVLLISGGKIGKDEKDKIKDYVERELQGSTGGFHKILIITARTDPQSGETPKMEFKPLTEALLNEGIFQTYDERNIDKVGMQFRQPRLLRGDIRDFNRATADAALRFTEAQVYSGERADFDFILNRKVMTRMKAKFWRLVSKSPPLRDPEAVVEMVTQLMKTNVMVPAEARRELSKVGVQLDVIDEPWTKRPIVVTMSGVGFEPEEGERILQPPDVAQAPAEGEAPTAPPAGASPDGEADSEGLKALEQQLFNQAQAKGVAPSALRSLNRAEILQQLDGEGNEELEDLLDGLGIE